MVHSIGPTGRCFEKAPFVLWHGFILAGHAKTAVVNGDHVRCAEEFSGECSLLGF